MTTTPGPIEQNILSGQLTGEYRNDYLDRFKKIEKIQYYINNNYVQIDKETNTYSWPHYQSHINFIDDTFSFIDTLIDLDFTRTYDSSTAHIEIHRIAPSSTFIADKKIIGRSISSRDIAYLSSNDAPVKKDFGYYRLVFWGVPEYDPMVSIVQKYRPANFSNLYTILHEIGHALGLSHPQLDGRDDPEGYWHSDLDTVMSYNKNPVLINSTTRFDQFDLFVNAPQLTRADANALRILWGEENDILSESFSLALKADGSISSLIDSLPQTLKIPSDTPRDLPPTDLATVRVSAPGWNETIQLIRVSKASDSGSRLQTRQPETGFATKVGSLIIGGAGSDVITGGFGWDIADGGGGNDLVKVGNGRDVLTGGVGADELWGGFGWNTFRTERDGSSDLLVIRSDQWLINSRQNNTAGNNADGSKADVIEELDAIDRIIIQGVTTADITVQVNASMPSGVKGIGIYARGALEALYIGSNLSEHQLHDMVRGDNSSAAIANTITSYGSSWGA